MSHIPALGGVEGGGLVDLEGVLGVAEKGEDAHVAAAVKEFAVVKVYRGGPRGKHLPVRGLLLGELLRGERGRGTDVLVRLEPGEPRHDP